jgi:hypothetical protein
MVTLTKKRKHSKTSQKKITTKSNRLNLGSNNKNSIIKKNVKNVTSQIGTSEFTIDFMLNIIKRSSIKNACYTGRRSLIKDWSDFSIVYFEKDSLIEFPILLGETVKSFFKFLDSCKKRFVVLPLLLLLKSGSVHFNMVIYDTKDKEMERFEPYGGKIKINFDKLFKMYIDVFMDNVTYFEPLTFCPNISFQQLNETYGTRLSSDPGGFCTIWSLWYMEMRLKYPDKSRKKIIDIAIQDISENKKGYRDFIRNYTLNYAKSKK